jgi:hypothetical protein
MSIEVMTFQLAAVPPRVLPTRGIMLRSGVIAGTSSLDAGSRL